MAKIRRKKTISARRTRSEAEIEWVNARLEQEKRRMFSLLNFEENLREKIEELFDIDFEGMLEGMEPMCFTKAVFQIKDVDQIRKKLKRLHDIDLAEDNPPHYVWSRRYPKGHWNPASKLPGARQILAHIDLNPQQNTLEMETKTKSWMHGLIFHIMELLDKEIFLVGLEFQNPLSIESLGKSLRSLSIGSFG